jgi:phage protein D
MPTATATSITYALSIAGSSATSSLLGSIQLIEVEDHSEMADMLRIRVAISVKDSGSGWTIVDDSTFERLTSIKLNVTVGSAKAVTVFNGYVIENDIEFSNQPNGSVLTVVAMDPTVLMHLEERVKAWPNMAASDVASAIFSSSDYGFTPVVQATNYAPHEDDHTLTQRGTDIQFLQQLANANGYECFIDLNEDTGDVEGHFHPPTTDDSPQSTLTINMGAATNVNRFRARYDMLGPTTATGTTVDFEQKSNESGQADSSNQSSLGSDDSTSTDRPRKVLLSGLGMGQSAEVQRYAQSVVDRSSWAITAEGELNTAAFGSVLRAKQPITVRGVGREFSGLYYVYKVVHLFSSDGNYLQRFTLRRNALGLTGREQFSEQQQ